MVDRPVLSKKVGAVRDAVARVRSVLPPTEDGFRADRTAREVAVLNLFVAVQEAIDVASHWIADEGWDVPGSYRELFLLLADKCVIDRALAARLATAAGFRNLVAHRYGVLDPGRVFHNAAPVATDLEAFCDALSARADRA